MTLLADGDPNPRLGVATSGLPTSGHDARTVLRHAFDRGIRLLDTPFPLEGGDNARTVRRALRHRPASLLVATVAGMTRCRPEDLFADGRPDYLRSQTEQSLRLLRVDRIDLLMVDLNPVIALDGQIDVLLELRHDGKINHIGLSDPTVKQTESVRRHLPVAAVRTTYHHAERRHEDLLDHCEHHGITVIPTFPFPFAADGALTEVAAEIGAPAAAVALAWLLQRSPVLLPAPAAATTADIDTHMTAAALTLTDDQEARL